MRKVGTVLFVVGCIMIGVNTIIMLADAIVNFDAVVKWFAEQSTYENLRIILPIGGIILGLAGGILWTIQFGRKDNE